MEESPCYTYFQKRDKNMSNFRGLPLLNIDSRSYIARFSDQLHQHFPNHMIQKQDSFVGKRSALSNLLNFLQDIHKKLHTNSNELVVAFHAKFSKGFNRVPHKLFLQKSDKTGSGGVLLEFLFD